MRYREPGKALGGAAAFTREIDPMTRGFWEVVNGLSTLVIAGATAIGFLSWRVSKQALEDDKDRKRKVTAVEQSALFKENLTVYWEAVLAKEAEEKYQADTHLFEASHSLLDAARAQMRRLESFAMYAETGLADQLLMLRWTGLEFTRQAHGCLRMLSLSFEEGAKEWPTTLMLLERWSEHFPSRATGRSTAKPI